MAVLRADHGAAVRGVAEGEHHRKRPVHQRAVDRQIQVVQAAAQDRIPDRGRYQSEDQQPADEV